MYIKQMVSLQFVFFVGYEYLTDVYTLHGH